MATFTGTAGADSLIGGAADDLFNFTPANLSAADTVQGGEGFDTLRFTAAGAVLAAALGQVSGIERILFANAGNALTLPYGLAVSAGNRIELRGGSGSDLVDATGLFAASLAVTFYTGLGGADTVLGGAGDDSVVIQAAGTRLLQLGGGNDSITAAPGLITAADAILGGTGIDRLTFTTAGSVSADALLGLSSIEEIALANLPGMTLGVTDALVAQAGGVLRIIGNNAAQAVMGAAVTTGALYFASFAGNDTFQGGAGADTIETADAVYGFLNGGNDVARLTTALAGASSLFGGDGHDQLVLTRGGDWILGPFVGEFEEVVITANGTRLIANATPGLDITGSEFSDRVTLGAAGQSFFGFEGNDTVILDAAMMPGVALHGGAQTTRDTLVLQGTGTFDFRRAFVTGFERFDVAAAATVLLPAQPIDVVARGGGSFTLGAHAAQSFLGSGLAESVTLGAAGQVVATRGGADTITGTAALLGAGTLLDGGGAFDVLAIAGGGAVNLATGALAQNIERIALLAATDLTPDTLPGIDLLGSDGADTIRPLSNDLTGDLGAGNDLVEIASQLLGSPGSGVLSPGGGFDTLRILQEVFVANFTIPARYTGFERLDLGGITFSSMVTIAGSANREILMPATRNALVFGGTGNELFQFAATGSAGFGGDGADTMNGSAAQDFLLGEGGSDLLIGGGGNDEIDGGTGADTLLGGAGNDILYINGNASLASWATQSRLVLGADPGQGAGEADSLLLANLTGTGTLDLSLHQIADIDRILIAGNGASLTIRIPDAMAATANALGAPGTIEVSHYISVTGPLVIDAAGLGAARHLAVTGLHEGADSLIGGAGTDLLLAAGGNDTVRGGGGEDSIGGVAGGDELRGEDGADSILGGAGGDSIWGDAGPDTLDGGAADGASDRFAYNSAGNGSADLNGAGGATGGADAIRSFVARASAADTVGDWIALSRAGLGLTGGNAVKDLLVDETWNVTTHTIFLVHQSDVLTGTLMADIDQIAAAVNTRAGAKTGWSNGTTVAFALSNDQAGANARTGIYLWKDDGDALLEAAGDDVRLLALVEGLTTATFTTETVVIA